MSTGNDKTLRIRSAGPNKKERPFIKTTAEKKIADDEFMAAAIGDVEWLRQSIRGNRGVINYDKNGLAPIHLSAIHGRVACLVLLVEKLKVDVNLPSRTGWRPLHLAISNQTGKRSFTCVQYLLSKGADPSSENDDGLMPMHQAASEGHVQCLKLLIDEGARIDGVDSRGHKPIDLAKLWGHRKCARILAAETWHREKDFVAHEMKQLDKVKMQEVLKEIEADEELKANQQFYGQEAFNAWLTQKGLPNQEQAEEANPVPPKNTLYKPNSVTQPDAVVFSPPADQQTLGRSLPPSRPRPGYEEDFFDQEMPLEGEDPSNSQGEFNPAPLPPTYTNPKRWNKSTKVPGTAHISKLPDHYPRDEYTMLPKHPPKRGGVPPPQARYEELPSVEVDTSKPLRVPKLPEDVINKVLGGDSLERPVVFKCRTILDSIQKRHPNDEKPRDEVGLHFGNDMQSFVFNSSLQHNRCRSRLTTISSKSSSTTKTGSGSVKLDMGAVAEIMKRMRKPVGYPNFRGDEYDLNLGQLTAI